MRGGGCDEGAFDDKEGVGCGGDEVLCTPLELTCPYKLRNELSVGHEGTHSSFSPNLGHILAQRDAYIQPDGYAVQLEFKVVQASLL